MPSPIVALDIIKTAMRLKGIIATGETPSADDATIGLQALNDVLETWSLEPYALWGSVPEVFTTVAGKAVYSIGPGGDWDTDRPTGIATLTTTWQGVDFTADEWTPEQYWQAGVKADGGIPERWAFVNDSPLAQVLLYPTPSEAVAVNIGVPRILTQVPAVGTLLILPPTYARALQYAVAEEIGPQFGSAIDLSGAARSTLAIIKRANRSAPTARFDPALMRCW